MGRIKKAFAAFLAVILMLSLTACGSAGPTAYSADGDNTHAIEAAGEDASYDNITVRKTGNGDSNEADFCGSNAAVLASSGAALTISNADIETDGEYATAVFSYGEGTSVNISDSTIKTNQRNSGGIMVTGGGELTASNLTVETEGGSSAAIRSDRGGGTITVDGGSYTANGSGSPAIYSTADISVSNATLQSSAAEAVVVEGGNKAALTDCDVTGNNTVHNSGKSDYYNAVMLYQSMSGDALSGDGSFTMTGGSLTSLNGGMFFVTNATYAINLKNVAMTYADDSLLRICAAGWGSEGSNGGQVTLNADSQSLEGNITVDDISKLNMYLANGSSFTGSFENEGEVYVELDDSSVWTLTSDCSISSLTCAAGCIDLNGYTLTVGGQTYAEGTASSGAAVVFTVSEEKGNPPEMPGGDGAQQPPQGENGQPPEKPEGDAQQPPQGENGQPPEKPKGDAQQPPQGEGGNPPEMPKGDAQQPPQGGNGQEPPEKPSDN